MPEFMSLRQKLGSGGILLGFAITYPSPEIVERVAGKWDWLWVEGQHAVWNAGDFQSVQRAAEIMGIPTICRIPDQSYGRIGHVLDAGASGVMVPMVDTVEQARAVVDAARYPQQGHRSYGGRRPVDLYGHAYPQKANEWTTLVIQIETPKGVENVDAIAAVEHIDVLFVGPADYRTHLGLPRETPITAPPLADAFRRVAEAANRNGKVAGIPVSDGESLAFLAGMGFRFFGCGSDCGILSDGTKRLYDGMESARTRLNAKT
ncbi:MAG TPA: aldolase/citrate lyase family protein [Candidatus Brocadiia bacterium]|nr:aldolase/citrate lyase family protein [Candidatus Brocadiia bacterium]